MNAQAHIAKLPRVSSIDIAVAAFVLWLMVDDLLLQGREFELFAYLRLVALLLCYVGVRLLRCRAVIVLGAVAVWTLVEVAVALLQLGSIIESNHLLFGMTGTFGNPGPLGGFVAMGIVVMAGLMATMRSKAATATVAALTCLAAVVLVCADSRAGWLATAVGIAYLFGRYIARAWRRIPIWGKCVALVVSAGVLVAAYFYKEKSANGRLLIWHTTIDMIADSPLTGHGSGSHAEQYMYYQAKYFEANPESPLADRAGVVARSFNDLLRVWSEGGLVALLIVVFIVCHIDWRAKRWQHTVNAAMLSIATFALFSYPSYLLPFQLAFAALLGCAASGGHCGGKCKTAVAALALAACAGTLVYCQCRVNDADAQLQELIAGREVHIDTDTEEVICATPRLLSTYATYAATHGDVEILELAARKSPSPDLLCDLAVCNAAAGDHANAESWLHTAHYMVPGKIRPQYELYRLYVAEGDTTRARMVVENVTGNSIDAKSSAALRMIGEMKRFYENTTE